MSKERKAAWNAFWGQARRSGGGGCLPGGSPALERAQRAVWQRFAQGVVRNGRVLDLATGDGRVMAWMREKRGDLAAIGVDLADELPPAPSGTSICGGVAMEELPFADASFDVVVSQFGFEYGDVSTIACEIRRVLVPGGAVALLTHREDGVILAHNRARRDAIAWAVDREDLPGIARRSLSLRAAGISSVPPAIATAPARGQALFGQGSAAWEIAEAIRRTLELGRMDAPQRVAASIDAIAAMAIGEIARISALEAACEVAADERALAEAFAGAGLEQTGSETVRESPAAKPFADFRTIRIS